MKYVKTFSILIFTMALMAGCKKQAKTATTIGKYKNGSLIEIASYHHNLSMFVKAVNVSGTADLLQFAGPFTVFAPSNKAFKKLPPKELHKLMNPPHNGRLAKIIKYNIIKHRHKLGELEAEAMNAFLNDENYYVTSLEGQPIQIQYHTGGLRINKATVIANDIAAINGWIHITNKVLIPPKK